MLVRGGRKRVNIFVNYYIFYGIIVDQFFIVNILILTLFLVSFFNFKSSKHVMIFCFKYDFERNSKHSTGKQLVKVYLLHYCWISWFSQFIHRAIMRHVLPCCTELRAELFYLKIEIGCINLENTKRN